MKTNFILALVAIFAINTSFAQKKIGTYELSYLNKQYDIEASEIKNEKFSVYIQVSAEREFTRAMIEVQSEDLAEFKEFLLQLKNKYVEWAKVATENDVKELTKPMDLKSPPVTICWRSSKWFFSYGHKLQPTFMILDSKKMVASIYKKASASSNQYIDETIYVVFADVREIDDLIQQLDETKIEEKLKNIDKTKDLFKD